jgi:uncharacterized protein YcbX
LKVAELWRYPVKGLRGESLPELEIADGGIPGDRMLRVVDERGTVTGRRKQGLVGLPATLGADGEPLIAGARWDSATAADAVRALAGDAAELVRAKGGHAHDLAHILLVTDGGLAQLGYDRRRFRPNIVVAGAEGPEELDWVGRRLRVGAATLFVEQPCERCVITTIDPDTIEVDLEVLKRTRDELDGLMGVYCSVLEPGAIAVGDAVKPAG